MAGTALSSYQEMADQFTHVRFRSKRRLLFLLPFPPRLDASHGGGRATAQLLANLATRHRIALLYLRAPVDPQLDTVLQERCEVVEEIIRPNPGFSLSQQWPRMRSLLRGWPMWAASCSVGEYSARVRTLARTWRPDIVHIEYHVMGQYLSSLDGCPAPRVLSEHEPGISAARDLLHSHRGLARIIYRLDLLAWQRFERSVISQVQAVIVFTERDQQALGEFQQQTPIVRIPLCTIIPEQPLNPQGDEPLSLLFVGNFRHPPNVDAAARLINEIFPRVRTRLPGLVLHIVGDDPPTWMRQIASKNIIVTGHVPSVTPYLDRAALVVAPISLGGGMRVKVLEALAAGKAVVASPLAIEGLDLVDGQHVVLATNDEQISDAIVQLLTNPERRAMLAACARAWACANLSWEKSISAYEALDGSLIKCSSTACQL